MANQTFIVVSGLPASGKTTLAMKLVEKLGLPLFDKDAILEALFEDVGDIDMATRQRLSRDSDNLLARSALTSGGAVIVSFWRHPKAADQAGTTVEWLKTLAGPIVEVHCVCPPALAEQRFKSRQRHPGHNDAQRSESLAKQMQSLSELGPLGLWPTVSVRTDGPYDVSDIVRSIQANIG